MDGPARRARLARARLYLVIEARPHDAAPDALLDAALRGGVDIVQLRDKSLSDEALIAAAEPFRRACGEHGALFVLNDRPDLAEACGADGVHVGQGDTSPAEARRQVGPDRIVGLSTHSQEQMEAAGGVDYLGVGTVFATPTKPDNDAAGIELVATAAAHVRRPWFAIGGIDGTNVTEVAAAGAYGVAVVRAIRDAADPESAARALREQLPPSSPVVCGPGEERRARLPQLDLLEDSLAAGEQGARVHTHRVHTNVFYVLEGELELRLGNETVRVPAGSCVTAPPLLVHGFRNPGTTVVRYLDLHAPGVFARDRDGGRAPEQFDTVFGTEGGSPDARGTISGPGDGDRLAKEHLLLLVKSSHPDVDVFEFLVSDGYTGATPHIHLRHADCFVVLEGELEMRADGETYRLGPGASIVVPAGVVHSFTSIGAARFLNVHAPACGFVEYLRRVDAGEEVDETQYDVYDV